MKMRILPWINTKTEKVRYGIQARHNGKWMHCCEGTKPLFFRKKERAQAYILKHGD